MLLSENCLRILRQRYLHRDVKGSVYETPEELFRRVANVVASAELGWGDIKDVRNWEDKYYSIMSNLLFLPNSPTLMNAGIAYGQLSACFVLPLEDNMNSIFSALKNAALIQQSGGGTGFNFSHLRPKDDPVTVSGGTASGPLSFMKIFDAATANIKLGGKRRGANMGILNIDHPDIEEFIFAKRENGVLDNFNISVGVTDEFMNTLEKKGDWDLIHPNSKTAVKKINAEKLWNDIIETAWQTGDPGLIFLDNMNIGNPTPELGKMESTNPCGEVPLLAYEPCNLGSINLAKFMKHNNGNSEINWPHLEEVIHIASRFLDNVIVVNNYIIPEIRAMALGNRKIGLGVMGWAELLIQLEIPYDSDRALRLAEQLMQFIQQKSKETSIMLAKQRGAFINWEKSIYFHDAPVRNATKNSIAPTGTISIIADTSSSIEPLFGLAFHRTHVLNGETLNTVNRYFVNYLRSRKLFTEDILRKVLNEGSLVNIKELPADVKDIFKTAMEIPPIRHLQHQVAFQKYTDNAVSKTINLPESADKKEVDEIYRTAWRLKAKGITIFRCNSKGKQVMHPGIIYGMKSCKVCIE